MDSLGVLGQTGLGRPLGLGKALWPEAEARAITLALLTHDLRPGFPLWPGSPGRSGFCFLASYLNSLRSDLSPRFLPVPTWHGLWIQSQGVSSFSPPALSLHLRGGHTLWLAVHPAWEATCPRPPTPRPWDTVGGGDGGREEEGQG